MRIDYEAAADKKLKERFRELQMASDIKLSKFRFQYDRPISGQIYHFLRNEITSTGIMPGTALSENELSAHFQVSRQPVREALMRLRLDGLLKVIPQRGSIVQKISVSNLRQICFVRSAIECASVSNAKNLNSDSFKKIIVKLGRNIEKQIETIKDAKANVTASFLALDDEFHSLICSLSTCPMAWENIQGAKPQMDRVRYLSMGGISPYEDLISEHQSIHGALTEGDFDKADELLRHHLYEIMRTYVPIREQYGQWFLPEEEDL